MISADRVAQTVERMSAMGPAEMEAIANRMQSEQPYIMVYMLAVTQGQEFSDEETETFFFAGAVIWQLMRENPNGKREITERILDEADEANKALMEKVAGDSAGDFYSVAETLALDSPEPEVFRYMVETIMEDEEGNPDEPPFSEEHLGAAFMHLKTVLDAFVAGQKKL